MMPKPRPPYLHRNVTRHGRVVWYVWKRPGPKVRIHGDYGSPDFMASYHAAVSGAGTARAVAASSGSLSELIEIYKESPAWGRLSPATQRQRGNILTRIEKVAGEDPFLSVDAEMIRETRDKLGPGAAKHFVQTMRGLFGWAVETGRAAEDPTAGVKVARPATDGFHTWTEEEIAAYEKRWLVGTRERLWLAVLLFTGLRRGDAVRLGPANIRDGVMVIQAAKTGVTISLPMDRELLKIISATKTGEQTFIATVSGAPMSKEFFGNLFREACDKANLKHCSAHGLRKAAATRLAEAGATVPQLNAVFGWVGAKQALHYVERADRAKLAKAAVKKLARR